MPLREGALQESSHSESETPVAITFQAPTEQEMIAAGLNPEGVSRILRVPWWEEMVEDIEETPDMCDPDDQPQGAGEEDRGYVVSM